MARSPASQLHIFRSPANVAWVYRPTDGTVVSHTRPSSSPVALPVPSSTSLWSLQLNFMHLWNTSAHCQSDNKRTKTCWRRGVGGGGRGRGRGGGVRLTSSRRQPSLTSTLYTYSTYTRMMTYHELEVRDVATATGQGWLLHHLYSTRMSSQ